MPPKIRAFLTLAVILTSAVLWFMRQEIALDVSPELLFGLTAFMCIAVWLFPEVKKDDRAKG